MSATAEERPEDIFDRLMALWQEPWSELAFGEAQMLLDRLREWRVLRSTEPLAAARARAALVHGEPPGDCSGLREKVEALPTQLGWDDGTGEASHWVDRAAVLALFAGERP